MQSEKKNPISSEFQKENSIQLNVRTPISKSGSFMRRDRRNSRAKKKTGVTNEYKLVEDASG
jgi:hypothetical protein